MIRKLLITTAAAALMAGGAYAQTQPAPAQPAAEAPAVQAPLAKADGQLATNIIGETVYNGTGDTAENIGDVNDLVIGADGAIEQMIVGVGGFLGIGEKNVAVDYKTAEWAEKNGDRWLVVGMSKEELGAAPAFDPTPYEPAQPVAAAEPAAPAAPADNSTTAMTPAPAAPADTAQAPAAAPAAPADTAQAPAAPAADATSTAAIDKSTLTEVPADKLSTDTLKGTTVYGADDTNLGEIGDVIVTADGKVDAVVIDVGGFLGVGEKPVAVGMDNLAFMADKDGNQYLYTTFTKEQLEAHPAYDAATFAEKRDEQVLKLTR